jgi:glycosyl transferase family 87
MSMSAGTEAMRQRAEPPVERPVKRTRAIPGFNPRAEDALAHLLARIPTSWLLLTSTVLTAGIYAALVFAFPITRWWNHPHLANDPNAVNDLGRITHYSPFAAIAFVAAILLLCWCQFLAISAIARPTAGHWRPVGLAAPFAFAGALVWMQPVTTTDLYGYVARGYLLVQLHLNPMTNPAYLLPGNLLVNRPPAPYGPAWLLLCGLFSMVAGNNLLLNMLLFKLFSLACLALSSWLLYRLAQRMEIGVPATVVMFFTWNPLVLFEAIGNGHNDIAMMTCVLAALLLTSYRHPRSALALLVFGALIKYTAALLIPLWLVYELNQLRRSTPYTGALAPTSAAAPEVAITARRGQTRSPRGLAARTQPAPGMLSATGHTVMASSRAALSGLAQLDRRAAVGLVLSAGMLSGALTIAFYAPFWEGFKTFTGVGQQLKPLYYNGSLVQFVAAPLELLVPLSHYPSLDKTIRLLFYAIFAVYAWLQVHRLWMAGKQATLRDLATAGAKTFFAALLLIAFWFQPWYVIWLLALAALANKPFVRSQAAILSFGSLLTYAVGNYLFVHEKGIGQALFVQFFEVLVAFAPLLLLQVTPEEGGWQTILRRYVGLLGEGLRNRTAIWDRVMLALILIVAAMLRLTRLGNLFGSITSQSANGDALRQVSGDIRLILADARGLEGPFNLIEHALVDVFGPTPFAVLLPSAILGSLTVWLIYLVCVALFASSGDASRARSIGLLAALLAATSGWHVSLSRSGVQVVTLPLLLCFSLYLLLRAVRLKAPAPRDTSIRRHVRRGRYRRPASRAPSENVARQRMALFAASGLCAGLASDLASGLWVLPVLSILAFLYARKRLPGWFAAGQREIGVLAATALLTGLPGLWHYSLSKYVGFAPGAPLLARSTAHPPALSLATLPARVRDILGNLGSVIHVLLAQDYSAGGPSASDAPIIPAIITPFFVLGVVLIVLRWRRVSAMTLLLLLALPLLTTIFVDAQPSVMGAATALPAMSMISAVALWEVGKWLGSLPIALDRAHGARVFANPEYIGRFVLMVFLLVSAMRTFYWYFQATLPTTPPNTFVPT